MSQGFVNSQSLSLPLSVVQGGTGVTTSTGSGNTVLSTSPVLVTPTLGAATATSLTFSPSTNGIIGTTTNNLASAGVVGQIVTATAANNSVSLTSTAFINITQISLTAGDWDVHGNVIFSAAGSTTTSITQVGISTTTATIVTGSQTLGGARIAGFSSGYAAPTINLQLTATTDVFLVAQATFAAGLMGGGGTIYARRRR